MFRSLNRGTVVGMGDLHGALHLQLRLSPTAFHRLAAESLALRDGIEASTLAVLLWW